MISFVQAQDDKLPVLNAPNLQVKVPGLPEFENVTCKPGSCTIPWLPQYIVGFQRYGIGIVGILAVIAFMIGGIIWLTSAGNTSRVKEAKEIMGGALLGMLLLFSSYAILNLVNPNLTELKSITVKTIDRVDLEEIPAVVYEDITGGPPIEAFGPEMMALIKKKATEGNYDPCFLYTFVVKESSGRVNVIGHDENVSSAPAHGTYVKSGKKFKGGPINGGKDHNDDTPVCTKEDLCLDWRFSHGIGLTQVTIFAADGVTKNGAPAKKIGNTVYSAKELFNPDTSLNATMDYLKASGCGTDLPTCFRKYNGKGATAEQYAKDSVGIFSKCKQNGLPS